MTLPGDDELFMRSLSEAAAAVVGTFKPGKILYINFLTEIQPECDCMPAADVPVIQDLGILMSYDLVAVEQASIEMLLTAQPVPASLAADEKILNGDILDELHHKPYHLQIDEAERLGLGSRSYELVEVD